MTKISESKMGRKIRLSDLLIEDYLYMRGYFKPVIKIGEEVPKEVFDVVEEIEDIVKDGFDYDTIRGQKVYKFEKKTSERIYDGMIYCGKIPEAICYMDFFAQSTYNENEAVFGFRGLFPGGSLSMRRSIFLDRIAGYIRGLDSFIIDGGENIGCVRLVEKGKEVGVGRIALVRAEIEFPRKDLLDGGYAKVGRI